MDNSKIKEMRKIAFIVPSAATGKLSGELARREKILRTIASPDTKVDIYGLEKDPEKSTIGVIQSAYDAAIEVPKILKCAIKAEKEGYQALIISCGGDPGVEPLREIVNIPIIPPGMAAQHVCSMLGRRFSILTTGIGSPRRAEIHERNGLLKMVSIHPIGLSVSEVRIKQEEAFEAMVREGKRAVNEYGANSVTYGCMSMGFLMVDEKLTQEIGVPAVNPVKVSIKIAEMMIDLGLTHSKLAYRMPTSINTLSEF
jgi:allantoin racemase